MLVLASVLISFGWGLTPAKLALALALALPESQRVALFEALVVSAVGAEPRQGQIHSAIELQLLGDDAEGLGALFIALALVLAFYHLAHNVVWHILNVVGQLVGGQVYLVVSGFGVFPKITLLHGLFLG